MKKWIPYALTAAFMALLGFSYRYNMPRLKTWLIVQVATQSERMMPAQVLPSDIQLHLFPIGVSLEKIQVFPRGSLASQVSPMTIGELRVNLDFWQLMQGRVHISEILVSRPKLSIRLESAGRKKTALNIDDLLHFDKYLGLPVDRIALIRADAAIRINDPQLIIRTHDLSIAVNQGLESLGIEVVSPYIDLQRLESQTEVTFSTRGALRLTADELQISDLHIKKGKSIVRFNGELDGNVTKISLAHLHQAFNLKLQGLFDLADLTKWARTTFPKIKIPETMGEVKAELDVSQGRGGRPSLVADISAQKLGIEKFYIGDVDLTGNLRENVARIKQIRFTSDAGHAQLNNTVMKFGDKMSDPMSVTTEVQADNLSLHNLLKNLDVGNLPLELMINGKFPCSGVAYPKTNIKCQGTVHGDHLLVTDDHNHKPIVALDSSTEDGEMTVTDSQVTYDSKITIGSSHGQSHGTIGYNTGFDIAYSSDRLNFADVANLADLKLEGSTKVQGYTRGDSRAAIFSMDLATSQLWFENYGLDQATARLNYKSGILSFQNIKGIFGTSRYVGNVSYNVIKDQLLVIGSVPFVDANDLVNIFSRKYKFPLSISGTGSAQVKVSGPPRFNALTYQLKSSIFKGTIAGESFDRATFDIEAKKGEVKTDNVQIIKGHSIATMTGVGHPDGNIDAHISGRGFKLEESENVLKYASALAGDVDFDMSLKGYVLLPDAILSGEVKNASINEEPVADSQFQVRFSKNSLEGRGHFLGQTVQSSFIFPYQPSAPFKLDVVTQNFDFSPVLSILLQSSARNEFRTSLSSKIHLASSSGGFWKASGLGEISHLLIARGGTTLENPKPIEVEMKEGAVNLQNFALKGENSFLVIESNRPAKKKLDIAVNGKVDMSLLQILTPFLDDLHGRLSATCQIRADENGASVLGTGSVDDALIKVKDLVHPFQHLKADILFDQRKIILNSISSEFASGSLIGEGTIEIRGYKNVPVIFSSHITNMDLQIPDQIRSRGDTDLEISGNWFPYLLKGTYHIKGGLMKREFSSASGDTTTIQQSAFLPPKVIEDQFSPLRFDLNLDIQPAYQVKNSYVDSNISGNLKLTGTLQSPMLQGTITPQRNGKVRFRETEFDITGASVKFKGKPNDPDLFLTAVSNVDDFAISLLVQGTAQNPIIKLTSTPTMSEPEIVSLLATGVRPERFDTNPNETNRARDSGTKLSSVLLSGTEFKKEFQEKSGFNVDISAANINQPLPTQYTAESAMDSSGVSVPKIVISRQWTPKFGASASRTVGDIQMNDVQFKYRLNHSMSVVGSWEDREYDPNTAATGFNNTFIPKDLFGLDLQYKMEFR